MNYPFSRVLRHFEPCIIPIWLRLGWMMGGMVDRNSGIESGQSVIKTKIMNIKHGLFVLPDWMLSISVYCVILRLMENLQNYYPGIHYYYTSKVLLMLMTMFD